MKYPFTGPEKAMPPLPEPHYELHADRLEVRVIVGHYKVFPDGRQLKVGEVAYQPQQITHDDTPDGSATFAGGIARLVASLEEQANHEPEALK